MKTLLKNCILAENEQADCIEITDDFISYIGKEKDLTAKASGTDSSPQADSYDYVKDMSGTVIFPGLYNTHCHAAMTLLRGAGSDLPLEEWLFGHIFPMEDKLSTDIVSHATELAVLEMLSTGTVSFSDMYFWSEPTIEVCLRSGIKANIARCISADPDEAYADSYRAKEARDIYRQYHNAGDGRIKIDLALHAVYTLNENVVREHSAVCKEQGSTMQIHLAETTTEVENCLKQYGKTPVQWFNDLGTFDCPTAAAHCVHLRPADLQILKEKGVMPVHVPASNLKLASGVAPVPLLLKEGLTMGIGTDGAASNNNLNLIKDMYLCSILHKGTSQDPTAVKPAEVLKMATESGALIQGRKNCGMLKEGFKADLIAIDFNRPHMIPSPDPVSTLLYSGQGSDVVLTMIDGKVLYDHGEFLTLDKERVLFDAAASYRKLIS